MHGVIVPFVRLQRREILEVGKHRKRYVGAGMVRGEGGSRGGRDGGSQQLIEKG